MVDSQKTLRIHQQGTQREIPNKTQANNHQTESVLLMLQAPFLTELERRKTFRNRVAVNKNLPRRR